MSDNLQNPYESFGDQQHFSRPDSAPPKLQAPAIALMVLGGINALQSTYGLARNLLGMNPPGPPPEDFKDNEQLMELYEVMVDYAPLINIGGTLLGVVIGGLVLFGGWKMLKMQSYGMALTSAILAIVPCGCLSCCGVGQIIGIWSLVVLMDSEIKALFRTNAG